MRENNLPRILIGLIIAIIIVVVGVLFANGTIQAKWREWRQAVDEENGSVDAPIIPAESTATPLPATVAQPTPGAPEFTSYASPTPVITRQTPLPGTTTNLPESGPETGVIIALLLAGGGYAYYRHTASRFQRSANDISVL